MTDVVGIVGAGTMGAGIAQVALEAGCAVRLYDPDPAAVERGRARIADGLSRRIARRGLSGAEAADATANHLDRLAVAPGLDDVAAPADLIIEAVVEDLALKQHVFRVLDAKARPESTLATNTSALSVGAIASVIARPARVIGLHFFNPAPLMRLVEVVAPGGSDAAVVDAALARMTAWGKTAIRCADAPGFIVNRVNRPYTLEALRILDEGRATIEQVDAALRAEGFPMGPFELMDLIGLDVNLAAARGLFEAFGREPRFRPSRIQERLVAAGTLGRKTGSGFYRYDETGRPTGPANGVPAAQGVAIPAKTIVERIVLGVVNEAYQALGDGVAIASDIDVALRLGAGHPAGPFEQVDRLGGPGRVRMRLDRLARELGSRFEPAPALTTSPAPTAGR